MPNSDDTNMMFHDFQEIRRRIEKRLRSVQAVLIHAALFLVGSIAVLSNSSPGLQWNFFEGYRYGLRDFVSVGWITLWSVVLMAHGIWAVLRSGLSKKVRMRIIDEELRERLDQEDTHLLENPRRIFHIKGFLDEDIRQRAGVFVPLLAVLLYALVFWIRLTFVDGVSMWWSSSQQIAAPPLAQQVAIRVAPVLIVPVALVVNLWRRRLRDNKIMRLIAAWSTESDTSKTKHDSKGKVMRLSDDGELVAVGNDLPQQNPLDENALRHSGFHRQRRGDLPQQNPLDKE
jgi:hypothetical protein